jgi:rhamnosyltransferase
MISNKDLCCAIFISYNPNDSFINNVNQLVGQVSEILIIDNNSDINSHKFLKKISENSKITIIYNQKNLGIATALNQGVNYAIAHSYEWIATFDQDSKPPNNFIRSMFYAYSQYSLQDQLAIISPRYFNEVSQLIIPVKRGDINSTFFEIEAAMTSGNLCKTSIFEKVGLFEEDFFIDYVDYEFCLRCICNGFKIIVSSESVLIHNLGVTTSHKLFGKTYFTSNHPPLRRFYNARNRILLYRKYTFINTMYLSTTGKWIFYDMLSLFKSIVKIILFEHNKFIKIKFILKGIYHGILNRKGEYK